jgi:NitT/TauT family transport system permease protein
MGDQPIERVAGSTKDPSRTSKKKLNIKRAILFFASIAIGLLLWQGIVSIFKLPAFILPSPLQVVRRFITAIQDGLIQRHLFITLLEVVLGLAAGAVLATITGYMLAKSASAEKLVSPYLIASQAIPIVAIAPLLVIWFGPGLLSKVMICSLTVFFPILINTVVGLREVPQDLHYLMRSLRATPAKTLWYLEVPSALPIFLGGLRVGATLSVIGAIVGELVGSDRGLGFLINVGRGQYDTALVFVAVITLVIMASSLYALVLLLERRLLAWQTWRS